MKPLLRAQDAEVPVWASYTDVAMNVLVVLLFYLFTQATASTITGAGLVKVSQEQQQLIGIVNAAMPPHLRGAVTVTKDGQLLRYRFADRALFDKSKAALKESGREVLSVMGAAFQKRLGSFSRIQVEGHTDDDPIKTAEFASNWELSSARATSVVRFFEDEMRLDPKLLSSTGYSQYHPIDTSDSSQSGKDRNRRIEIVVVYSLIEANK